MDSLSKLLIPVICLFLMSYFGYHGLHGRYGHFAQLTLNKKLSTIEKKNHVLEAQKNQLEHRISLLKPEALSKDLLDELARDVLNLSDKNDAIIWSKLKK